MAVYDPKDYKNENISCNVSQCRYNSRLHKCCTLQQVDILAEAKEASTEHHTCCHSFEAKQ
ncbi:MAG: DUF1540 domain-containing protein [Oscillospiraceae bacterium]|nr:DUF1540 domain-containing protein [Oscillospiraceae bacterium]